ncbi:MAG: TolC family protein [Myxococcales bacterium]|nr:TolC family protein [Myxococcales bacterium]
MTQRALLLALTLAVSPVAGLGAEPPRASAPLLHGTLDLGLEDAVEMALENNLGVQVDRFDPLIAGLDADAAWGAFDPTFFGEFGYLDDKTPNSISFTGTKQSVIRNSDGVAGFRGLLPLLGTEYEGRFEGSRTTSNSAVETLSPRYESGWTLSLRQPLLKDLIWSQPWTQVRTTRINANGALEEFRSAVMNLVQSVEDAYWQLSADEEEVRVAIKSLETADALLDQTRTQFEVGVVSRVEVTEAEAGLEARRFNLIVAENRYRNQQDVLIDLVLGPGLHATSTLEIDPTDHPEAYVAYEIDVAEAVNNAFEHRPELSAARLRVENTGIQKQAAWNQRLPELDAVLSYGEEGLAGTTNPNCIPFPGGPACPEVRGNLSDTTRLYDDNPAFSVRAQFSIPIPNTAARKTYDRRELEQQRAQTRLRQLEQQIILEVRRASRNLEAAQSGIESARRAAEASQEQLRAERIRLEYGESTPFDVLLREEKLVDREVDRIEAYRAYQSSATALDRAQGTILRNRNIRIEAASSLR